MATASSLPKNHRRKVTQASGAVLLERYKTLQEIPKWSDIGTIVQKQLGDDVIQYLRKTDSGDVAEHLEQCPQELEAYVHQRIRSMREKRNQKPPSDTPKRKADTDLSAIDLPFHRRPPYPYIEPASKHTAHNADDKDGTPGTPGRTVGKLFEAISRDSKHATGLSTGTSAGFRHSEVGMNGTVEKHSDRYFEYQNRGWLPCVSTLLAQPESSTTQAYAGSHHLHNADVPGSTYDRTVDKPHYFDRRSPPPLTMGSGQLRSVMPNFPLNFREPQSPGDQALKAVRKVNRTLQPLTIPCASNALPLGDLPSLSAESRPSREYPVVSSSEYSGESARRKRDYEAIDDEDNTNYRKRGEDRHFGSSPWKKRYVGPDALPISPSNSAESLGTGCIIHPATLPPSSSCLPLTVMSPTETTRQPLSIEYRPFPPSRDVPDMVSPRLSRPVERTKPNQYSIDNDRDALNPHNASSHPARSKIDGPHDYGNWMLTFGGETKILERKKLPFEDNISTAEPHRAIPDLPEPYYEGGRYHIPGCSDVVEPTRAWQSGSGYTTSRKEKEKEML
ncbi:hypothetical protein MMC25_004096 [Agyrium rufum]|nr:hypothetical protein [Agyrium rufum]